MLRRSRRVLIFLYKPYPDWVLKRSTKIKGSLVVQVLKLKKEILLRVRIRAKIIVRHVQKNGFAEK